MRSSASSRTSSFLRLIRARRGDFLHPALRADRRQFCRAGRLQLEEHGRHHRPGRVTVARGLAYDLFLTRALKVATLFVPKWSESMENFLAEKLDAAAGVRQPIVDSCRSIRAASHRAAFMQIRQAMGMPNGPRRRRSSLSAFLHRGPKASGFVATRSARSGHSDVAVAPAA